jgi:hypothetical protein
MTQQFEQSLIHELAKMSATPVDPEILQALVPENADNEDPATIAKALVEQHPACFAIERAWGELSDTDFAERERSFRAGLRRSTPVGPNPFKDLDSALLDADQLQSLDRVLSGRGSSYDRSVLTHALAQQRQLLKETQ